MTSLFSAFLPKASIFFNKENTLGLVFYSVSFFLMFVCLFFGFDFCHRVPLCNPAGLELTVKLLSQLLSAGITGMHHDVWWLQIFL